MNTKFDNIDRKKVVDIISTYLGSPLSKIGKRHIYMKDESNMRYVIIGGTGNWHGIPIEVIEDIKKYNSDAYLVIAIKIHDSLSIFWGSISPLIEHLNSLPRLVNDRYSMHFERNQNSLSIKEVASCRLSLLKEVKHSEFDRNNIKNISDTENMIYALTESEKDELINMLKKQ
jgi:hypothetical protein